MSSQNEPHDTSVVNNTSAGINNQFDFSEPGKKLNFSNLITTVLRTPGKVIFAACNDKGGSINFKLFIIALASFAIYGVTNGLFSPGLQTFYAALKFPAIIILSTLFCLPSFFIFLALNGVDIKLREAVSIIFAAISVSSIIMIGFAPIILIFSQSTYSVIFMGILNIVFITVTTVFFIRIINKSILHFSGKNELYMIVWFVVFLAVIFQMSATLRPLLGTSDHFYNPEKIFFLKYWISILR